MPMDRVSREDPRLRLAPAIRRQLEALGYLGTSSDHAPADDPQ